MCEYSGNSTCLGPAILSFIEKLSSLRRLKCTSIIEKGPQSLSFTERFSIVWSVHYWRFCCTGPLPSLGCKVQLKWPDHVVVLNESEMREMEDCGLLPGRLRQRAGKESTEEKRDGEREEEVVLYHSVANDRTSHMVDGERQKEVR